MIAQITGPLFLAGSSIHNVSTVLIKISLSSGSESMVGRYFESVSIFSFSVAIHS